MSQTLSVVIAARNCKDRLGACVNPWLFAKEVIVADQQSSDGTDTLAKQLGCVVLQCPLDLENFDLCRKQAMQKAQGDWLLYIDTDEIPTMELLDEIKTFLNDPHQGGNLDITGVRIPNGFYFLGKQLNHGIFNPRSAEIRMVRKGAWHYPCEEGLHRGVSVTKGQVVTLIHHYKHFNVNSLSEWFLKTNQYTELDAHPSRARTWGAVWDFIKFFVRHFFWKRGFLDGYHGFLSVIYFGLYHFTLSAKSWEKSYLSTKTIEKDYLKPLPIPKR